MNNNKRFWRIQLFDGIEQIYVRDIPQWQIGSKRIVELLRMLVAKHALSNDEIVDNLANLNSPNYQEYLNVKEKLTDRYLISCGSNPHGLVSIVDHQGKPIFQDANLGSRK